MAFYHLRISLYLNLKAAHLLRSGCAVPAIGGNPELFILSGFRWYNSNIFRLNLFIYYLYKHKQNKVIRTFIFYKIKDAKDSLHVKIYFHIQPCKPVINQRYKRCNRIITSIYLKCTTMKPF